MTRSLRIAFLALCLFDATPTGAQEALTHRLDSLATHFAASTGAPGTAVSVVLGDQMLLQSGYGLADVELGMPVTAESVFGIASLTKQFTSAAIMKLVEAGKVSLTDSVSQHIPEYPGPGGGATLHHLLSHTSGIPDFQSLGQRYWSKMHLDLSTAEMMELLRDERLDFEPGTAWSYSNSGYYLLGMVIERVTGQPYASYLEDVFFGPLGLTSITQCDFSEAVPNGARGYFLEGDTLVNADPMSAHISFSAGALCSSVADLVRWSSALHSGRVVSPASLEAMTAPTTLADGSVHRYGYGLWSVDFHGARSVSHPGASNGFITELASYPDHDLTIGVLINGIGNPGKLEDQLAAEVLGFELPKFDPIPMDEAGLQKFVGTYRVESLGPLGFYVKDGGLYMNGLAQREIAVHPYAELGVYWEDFGLQMMFERAESGDITGVVVRGWGPQEMAGSRVR